MIKPFLHIYAPFVNDRIGKFVVSNNGYSGCWITFI